MSEHTAENGPPVIDRTGVQSRYPWPTGTYLQGGRSGVVVSPNGTRTTAFVEAFPSGSFIRGEGATVEEAEDSAWQQYQRKVNCPGHEWEARKYRNGGGICKHCGAFSGTAFTPEQLGCFCATCGVPTFWSSRNEDFFCETHATNPDSEWFRENTTGSHLGDLFGYLEAKVREADETSPIPPGTIQ